MELVIKLTHTSTVSQISNINNDHEQIEITFTSKLKSVWI